MPRVLLFDIEIAGNFGANAGFVLCVAYKWLGDKKVNLISIRDFPRWKKDCTDDIDVLKKISPQLEAADMWVTWYGLKFDAPFLQTRNVIQGLNPLNLLTPHWDGWRVAKYDLKFTRNSLDIVSRALPFTLGEVEAFKTHLDFSLWLKAAAGHKAPLKYIEEHCVADVKVLERAYLRMRPYSRSSPNLSLLAGKVMGCPSCGSMHINSRGFAATASSIKKKHRCMDCGRWFMTAVSRQVGDK